jgi:hypothetical protein
MNKKWKAKDNDNNRKNGRGWYNNDIITLLWGYCICKGKCENSWGVGKWHKSDYRCVSLALECTKTNNKR